jgi:DNA-binding beta-propeller fold protein YncE
LRTVLAAMLAAAAVFPPAQRPAEAQRPGTVAAPYFEVDPFWPKPLPNQWLIGSVAGVSVDDRDTVWIVHRPPSLGDNERGLERGFSECCAPAPPVLAFDRAGRLIASWGGPEAGYDWPQTNHGVTADREGNVWLGGSGDGDSHVLKFTRAGVFVKQFGRAGARRGPDSTQAAATWVGNSHDLTSYGRVAKIDVDAAANEAYLSDGYLNKRVAVIDTETGAVKRYWGAYGSKPDDTALGDYRPEAPPERQFRGPVHCAVLSVDGLVYVCDRMSNRIQVFRKDGTFVKEAFFAKATRGARPGEGGSVSDIAFSADRQQTYMYVADLLNAKIRVLRRDTLEELTSFGGGGRQPGQFYGPHNIATDSRGDIYLVETFEGKRIQKFIYKGVRNVVREQGVVWPR